MTLNELNARIQADIPALKTVKELVRAYNDVVRFINLTYPGHYKTEKPIIVVVAPISNTMSFSGSNIVDDGGDDMSAVFTAGQILYTDSDDNPGPFTIASFTTTVSSNDTIVVSETLTTEANASIDIGAFTVDSDYSWDLGNHVLTLDNSVKKLIDVFHNNVELEARSREFTYDSDNQDEEIYTMTERDKIYVPTSFLDAASDTLAIKALFDLATITTATTTLTLPQQVQQTVIHGIFSYLFARPQYRDETMYTKYSNEFTAAVKAMNTQEDERLPSTSNTMEYIY